MVAVVLGDCLQPSQEIHANRSGVSLGDEFAGPNFMPAVAVGIGIGIGVGIIIALLHMICAVVSDHHVPI